ITAPDGGTIAYTYDGELMTETRWIGAVAGTVNRTYDENFRLTSLRINGADPTLFSYDRDNLLTQAGDLRLTRDQQNGLLTGTTRGNGGDGWSYNGFGEPVDYAASYSGAVFYATHFDRDSLGRITAKTETIGGVTDAYVYTYDIAGRLTD